MSCCAALDELVLTDVVEGGLYASVAAVPWRSAPNRRASPRRRAWSLHPAPRLRTPVRARRTRALVATVRTLQAVFAAGSAAAAVAAPAGGLPAAKRSCRQGCDFIDRPELDRASVIGMVGVHVQPVLPAGAFSAAAGPINASADTFEIVVRAAGPRCLPASRRDPIVAAAVIRRCSIWCARRPIQPAVVTVKSPVAMLAGARRGDDARHGAPTTRRTVRCCTPAAHRRPGDRAAYGCTADVDVNRRAAARQRPGAVGTGHAALRSIGLSAAPPWRSCGADDAYYGTACRR